MLCSCLGLCIKIQYENFRKKKKEKKKKLGVLQKDKSEVRLVGYIEAVIGDSC